jgi:hypothetical protein
MRGYKLKMKACSALFSSTLFHSGQIIHRFHQISSNMCAKSVPVRKLGKNGPSVPALGFGLMGMSFAYGTLLSDEERFKVLDRAVDLGATFWDTAE